MSHTPENPDDQITTADFARHLGLNVFNIKWLEGFVRLMIGVAAQNGHKRLKIIILEHRYPKALQFMNQVFGTVYSAECLVQTPIPNSPEVEFFLQQPLRQMKIRGLRPFIQDDLPGFSKALSGLAEQPGT